jgi:type III secretion protein U
MSEKNEKPTSKKLREARKRGQIVKSTELTSAVQLSCIAALFYFCGADWFSEIAALLKKTLDAAVNVDTSEIKAIVMACAWLFIRIIGLTGSCLLMTTLGIQFAQVGVTLASEAFSNVGQKLNPLSNLKQMFSFASLFELLKSILKLCVVGGIFSSLLQEALPNVQYLSRCGAGCALVFTADLIFRLFLGLLSAYVFFAIADYAFQKQRINKQLMMSREEIKQEYKDAEGSQEVKQQRKELHREMQQGSMKSNVRKSSFIIRNPKHIAICVWYHQQHCPLPKILDKYKDKQALAVVALAEAEAIPMVENIPLARSLFKAVSAGQYITPDYYEDMAAVIHFIEEIQRTTTQTDQ